MLTALIALPFAAQLIAPLTFSALAATVTAEASEQSQFTRPAQPAESMRFREMDRNNDGVVTRAEWRGSEQSFRAHDWNGDGILSGEEVRPGALRSTDRGREDAGIRDDREDTFENLDVNGNNQIERHEWHASADAFDWLDRNKDGVLSRREVVGRAGNRTAMDRNASAPTTGDTGTAATAARQNCDDNAARIVDDIYQQVLERPADQSSAGFTQALASGRTTVRQIVAQLARSEEHATRYFWAPVMTTVYRQIMNREPSQEELRQTTADLAAGRRQLIDVIARSARRAASNDEEAVRILYQQLLGREADPEGLRGYTQRAQRQGIESVARDIVSSPEYRRKTGGSFGALDAAAYDAAARTVYRHVLGRDPDPAMTQRVAQAAAANGFSVVVDSIVSSPEYERLYGNDVVPGRGSRYCGATR